MSTPPVSTPQPSANSSSNPNRGIRQAQCKALGGLISGVVTANLPPNQRPVPAWKQKQLDAAAAAEKEAKQQQQQQQTNDDGGGDATKNSSSDIPDAAIVAVQHTTMEAAMAAHMERTRQRQNSKKREYNSPFAGDYWSHREINELLAKHRAVSQEQKDDYEAQAREQAEWRRREQESAVVVVAPQVPSHSNNTNKNNSDGGGGGGGATGGGIGVPLPHSKTPTKTAETIVEASNNTAMMFGAPLPPFGKNVVAAGGMSVMPPVPVVVVSALVRPGQQQQQQQQ